MGKINFLRRFISNLSGEANVFSSLLSLKKEGGFKWEQEYQKYFDQIKTYLMNPPILLPLMRNRSMKLYIYASELTIKSMLAQEDDDGVKRVIYYLTQVLNDVETRCSPIEKLYLCLYFSCNKLKCYIKSTKVLFIPILMLLSTCSRNPFYTFELGNELWL